MVAPNVVKKGYKPGRRRGTDTGKTCISDAISNANGRDAGSRPSVRSAAKPQEIELIINPISLSVAEVPILGKLWMKVTLLAIEEVRVLTDSLTLPRP
jgi:hypothetical protein